MEIKMPIEVAEIICSMAVCCQNEQQGGDYSMIMLWIKDTYPELVTKLGICHLPWDKYKVN